MSGYVELTLRSALAAVRTGPAAAREAAARVVAALVPSADATELDAVMTALVDVAEARSPVRTLLIAIADAERAHEPFARRLETLLQRVSPAAYFELLVVTRERSAHRALCSDRTLRGCERALRWATASRARPAEDVAWILHGAARRTRGTWPSELLEAWPELMAAAGPHQHGLAAFAPTAVGWLGLARGERRARAFRPAMLAEAPLERALVALEEALERAADGAERVCLAGWQAQLLVAREARP